MLSILHLSGGLHDLWDGLEIFRTSSFEEKYYNLQETTAVMAGLK